MFLGEEEGKRVRWVAKRRCRCATPVHPHNLRHRRVLPRACTPWHPAPLLFATFITELTRAEPAAVIAARMKGNLARPGRSSRQCFRSPKCWTSRIGTGIVRPKFRAG